MTHTREQPGRTQTLMVNASLCTALVFRGGLTDNERVSLKSFQISPEVLGVQRDRHDDKSVAACYRTFHLSFGLLLLSAVVQQS